MSGDDAEKVVDQLRLAARRLDGTISTLLDVSIKHWPDELSAEALAVLQQVNTVDSLAAKAVARYQVAKAQHIIDLYKDRV